MRKLIYTISLLVWAISPVTIFGQTSQFQQSQTSSVFFTQQKGATLSFHVAGDNSRIVADVFALSGKHIARVLDKVVSQGDYTFGPFAGTNLPRQTFIIRLSNGVQTKYIRMINVGSESVSCLRPVQTGSARLAKVAGNNEKVIKTYQSKEIGNGVYLNQIFNDVDDGSVYRGFRIEVKNDGNYYLSAWMEGLLGSTRDVLIDGQILTAGKIKLQKQGWQASYIVNNSELGAPITIHLSSGNHDIVFRAKGPGIPEVEFIKLGTTEIDAFISDTAFQNRLAAIKAFAASHPIQSIKDDTTKGAIALLTANDPKYDYAGCLGQPYTYTYRGWYNFNANDHVVFDVRNATTNCVMYLFNTSNLTESTSFFGFSSIDVTIPTTGSYILMVRAYFTGYSGTGDLYLNNSINASGITIAGNYYNTYMTKSGVLNYFTCNPPNSWSADTWIYITTYRMYTPIAAYNDDYRGSGDYFWGYWSRCQIDLSGWYSPYNQVFLIGTAYSSYGQGNCDYYLCNSNGNELIGSYFPYLKADDAIKSALATPYGDYNCIAYSGGITNDWFNPFYSVAEFDNFYISARYPGCEKFTRTGATWNNSKVDVWATGTTWPYTGTFTHGSVCKPSNAHMHGYDWESKCGYNIRGFHPRTALRNPSGGYGYPVFNYISDGFVRSQKMVALGIDRPLSFEESVKLGLTKVDKVIFNADEQIKLTGSLSKIPSDITNEFNAKFEDWRKTWDMPPICFMSNTRDYAKSDEYKVFLDFCQKQGKTVWPLLFSYFQNGNLFLVNIFEDLVLPGRNNLIDEVKTQNESNKYTLDGTYVYHTMKGDWLNFCKKVLEREIE